MPQISVIVPVYKAEAYLAACIDSILGQTFSDLEVILVDDGSPDGCWAICQDYCRKDPRVKALRQENQGQAAARNLGLTQAQGQWVSFVDSDDLIHPQMLQLLHEAAIREKAPVSMCRMLEAPSLPEDFFAPRELTCTGLAMDEKTLLALYDGDAYPGWVACAKLIRKELVLSHLFCPGRVYEDNEAVCHWLLAGKGLAQIPDALYFYRTNPDSTTKKAYSAKQLDYLWALEQIILCYRQAGYHQLWQRFCRRYYQAVESNLYGLRCLLHQPAAARACWRRARAFFRSQGVHLTRQEQGKLLDAAAPAWARVYWPVSAGVALLAREGPTGLFRRIVSRKEKPHDS